MQLSRQAIVADYLEKQLADGTLTDERIWKLLKVSEATFYRLKPAAKLLLDARLTKKRSLIESTANTSATEAVRKGLKTRVDRLFILQEQVDKLRDALKKGNDIGHIIEDGKIKSLKKKMSQQTRAYLQRTLRELQGEISKIEGDYAPEKKTHDFNSPVVVQTGQVEIDYSKLSSAFLEEIVAQGATLLKDK